MTFRKGDIVHVLAEVRSDFDSAVETHVEVVVADQFDLNNPLSVRPDALTLISRSFVIGETVKTHLMPGQYKVLGVDGGDLWLRGLGNGRLHTIRANDAELIEPPTVIPGGAGTWVEPPPTPASSGGSTQVEDVPEKFVGGVRTVPKLFGIVPPDSETGGTEITYTTAQGDTLAAMAYVFQTSVDTIKVMNPSVALMDTEPHAEFDAGVKLQVNDNRLPF